MKTAEFIAKGLGGRDSIQKRITSFIILFALLFSVTSLDAQPIPEPIPVIPPTLVGGHCVGGDRNQFAWDYLYTVSFDAVLGLTVDEQINFIAGNGVSANDLAAAKQRWIAGIENAWNNQFDLLKDDLYSFPIHFDITDSGPFDQNVLVNTGNGRADLTHWYLDNSGLVAGHEFGHMLGLFDEYIGGATDPENPIISEDLMGSVDPGAGVVAEYYQQFADWMDENDPYGESWTLQKVPEPSSLILLGIGAISLVAYAWRKRKPSA
jgi:hypothetical protein